MTTKEILTLQFGHYANFVGTHWWNLQESSFDYNSTEPSEINHNVLYREGLTTKVLNTDYRTFVLTHVLLLGPSHFYSKTVTSRLKRKFRITVKRGRSV